jgi:hypothetical protein
MFARFRSPGLFVVHLTHMTLEAIVISERRRASFESADKSPSCLLLNEDVVGLDRRRRAANQMLVSDLSSNEVGKTIVKLGHLNLNRVGSALPPPEIVQEVFSSRSQDRTVLT